MKSILKNVRPNWMANILNGDASLLIAKKFPAHYRGWVYIHCTNDRKDLCYKCLFNGYDVDNWKVLENRDSDKDILNGKVVARFWCDFIFKTFIDLAKSVDEYKPLLKDSCLTNDELKKYVGKNFFYAVHISKLEIFDEPKELSDFVHKVVIEHHTKGHIGFLVEERFEPLIKAPQNFCYIESEE